MAQNCYRIGGKRCQGQQHSQTALCSIPEVQSFVSLLQSHCFISLGPNSRSGAIGDRSVGPLMHTADSRKVQCLTCDTCLVVCEVLGIVGMQHAPFPCTHVPRADLEPVGAIRGPRVSEVWEIGGSDLGLDGYGALNFSGALNRGGAH